MFEEDIDVTVNNQPVGVFEINRLMEAIGEDQSMHAYVIQTSLPQKANVLRL